MAEWNASGEGRIDLSHAEEFSLGSGQVRPSLLEVQANGTTIPLEPRVMQLLVALWRANGAPVSRDDLIVACWGGLAISDDAITQCVSKLRRAISGLPGVEVASVPRVGYRLAVSDAAGTVAPRAPGTGTWFGRSAAAVLVIAGVSMLGFDSRSVAVASSDQGKIAASVSTPQSLEADRLHAAAVRIFRERTRPGYAEAEKLLRRAIAIDPNHAPTWARLSMVVYAPWRWAAADDADARAHLRSEADRLRAAPCHSIPVSERPIRRWDSSYGTSAG